jgi:hypothetical protein
MPHRRTARLPIGACVGRRRRTIVAARYVLGPQELPKLVHGEGRADGWARELRWFARQPLTVRRLALAALRRYCEVPPAYRVRFEALAARTA